MTCIKVELTDCMGTCLKVCQMAKDSFGRTTDWAKPPSVERDGFGVPIFKGRLHEKDQRLLKMLARGMGEDEYQDAIDSIGLATSRAQIEAAMLKFRNTSPHLAPFGHNFATFKFQAPVFVMRQIVKHKFIRISELSMRYVRGMPEYYRPKSWRAVADSVKQGSGGDHEDQHWNHLLEDCYIEDKGAYELDLKRGLAPEQARMFLRLCHMTQGHLSGSMDALANLVKQRLDPHAQEETREFARFIDRQCAEIWPWSWAALMEGVDRT